MARLKGSKDKRPRNKRAKKQDTKESVTVRLHPVLLSALREAAESKKIDSVSAFIESATTGAAQASKIYTPINN